MPDVVQILDSLHPNIRLMMLILTVDAVKSYLSCLSSRRSSLDLLLRWLRLLLLLLLRSGLRILDDLLIVLHQ